MRQKCVIINNGCSILKYKFDCNFFLTFLVMNNGYLPLNIGQRVPAEIIPS
jgi:hypothetical protein